MDFGLNSISVCSQIISVQAVLTELEFGRLLSAVITSEEANTRKQCMEGLACVGGGHQESSSEVIETIAKRVI